MNLRDLRYFVALADTRHFGKAAERSFVSQPTLSAQIKKLENYLGVQLIERQPRKVTLTETGAKILPLARRILQESDEIVSLARNEHDPLSGKLKVGFIPTIGPYLLPLVARKLRKQLPRLKLMLYEYQTQPLLEKLRAGDIELGILALPVPLDGLEARELYDEDFTLAVPNNNPLAKKSNVQARRSQRRDAAAARRRPLPARPGAGRLQPHRREGERGLSRHQPGNAAADGGGRARHHVAAGARDARPVRLRPGLDGQSVHAARPFAHRRRSLAQEHGAHGRDQGRVRRDPLIDVLLSTRWPKRACPASATCTTTRSSRCCAPAHTRRC